jgi:hypothetical protein
MHLFNCSDIPLRTRTLLRPQTSLSSLQLAATQTRILHIQANKVASTNTIIAMQIEIRLRGRSTEEVKIYIILSGEGMRTGKEIECECKGDPVKSSEVRD